MIAIRIRCLILFQPSHVTERHQQVQYILGGTLFTTKMTPRTRKDEPYSPAIQHPTNSTYVPRQVLHLPKQRDTSYYYKG